MPRAGMLIGYMEKDDHAFFVHSSLYSFGLGDMGQVAIDYPRLVRLYAATSVSLLAKEVKSSSSHLATHVLKPGQFFKWQGSYGALSCWEQDIPRLKAYIENQRAHHDQMEIEPIWETVEDSEDHLGGE